jgi:two-component system, cell cycle sensor histidine kinase and response regulator CckA
VIPQAAGLIVLLLGVSVFVVGWILDVRLVTSVVPGLATMKANTAIGFILCGASLLLSVRSPSARWAALLARVCGVVTLALAVATLLQYLGGWTFGIDELLFSDPNPRRADPGRMSPLTASCFALWAGALLARASRPGPSQLLALVVVAVAGLTLLGYLYSARGLLGIASYSEMAVHTALSFVLLAMGLLFLDPASGVAGMLTSDSMGGTTARRLLPVVIVAPAVLGWVSLQGQRAGRYGTEMGVAIVVITMISVLSVFVWMNARALLRLEAQRREAEGALRGREAHMRSVLDSALDAVVTMNASGDVTYWSRRAEQIFGWPAAEAVGQNLGELLIPESLREAHRQGLARYNETGQGPILGRRLQMMALRRDGTEFPVELSITAVEEGGYRSFCGFIADLSRQVQTEAALQRSEERYRHFFEDTLSGAFIARPDGTILACNPPFARMFGFNSVQDSIGSNVGSLCPVAELRDTLLQRLHEEGRIQALDVELCRADRTPVSVIANVVGAFNTAGELTEIKGYVLDNTERRKVEEQLRQSQRIDAIGRLAGGVAHDFNNLLGVISGNNHFLLRHLPPDDARTRYAVEIGKAADRAAALTRQLLAFSRKQILQPQILDLNSVVREMEQLLLRLIGEDIDLVVRTTAPLGRVRADPGQIEQVIMNLAVNARDAMPQGGRLTIETANVALAEDYARQHPGTVAGSHVMVAITDTGHGMDEATKARAFEPFFSTKEKGQGTGLGLATVYGIVKQSGGSIYLYSEPGCGTSCKIYLPEVAEGASTPPIAADEPISPCGSETILVVEDEDMLREIVQEALEALGYSVLKARHGTAALSICASHDAPIHLVLTDAVMPGLSVREMVDRVRALRPGVRILYMSGYTDDTIVRHGVLLADVAFLQKPFTLDALAHKVRAALDAEEPRFGC